jgi:hypothetical protein
MEEELLLSPSHPEVLIGALALIMIVATVILIVFRIGRGCPGAPIED